MENKTLKFTGERLIPKINVGQAFYYEHLARYFFASQIVKNKTVLDLGCGSGYGSYILKNIGHSKKVVGIDISKDAITYAKENYGKNIKFSVGDIHYLKDVENKSIDIITCFEVLEHTDNQEQMITEIKRVLKNNGVLIISTPNILTYPKGNKYHVKELSLNEFKNILEKYFKNINLFFQNFFLSEEIVSDNDRSDIDVLTSEKLSQQNINHYRVQKDIDDSEYLLAICSNSSLSLPEISPISISTNKVDHFNLKHGILSLSQQFFDLQESNKNLSKQIEEINQLVSKYESENQNLSKQIEEINQLVSKYESENQNLSKQIEEINQKNILLQKNVKRLKSDLNKIQSSKTYKIWQDYNKIKKYIFKKQK